MSVLRSFPPIINARCRVLILGSMPGVQSLEAKQYYAHPQNQFWRIMADILGCLPPTTYARKKAMLLKNRIALWDVIDGCHREGSSDANIRDIKSQDFGRFFKKYPNIKAVFCNGQTALRLFHRHYPDCRIPVVLLPSTSPAHTQPMAWKVKYWKAALREFERKTCFSNRDIRQ